ncbi:hypothetical protein BKA67DRAFT_583339 [Truncatella angustata]|uniref:Uncharacterized protein n=1 Tax=Truncatella angustata TaxID=152316 RepID=A0A9P8RHJ2_9PEZI|nr:uncharacterized protein BKA67DRAFT_583339 [Truncatella angustata]KAH6646134.1 hypothetical protein BKA67DRAFT_583339 [Truncatella angustata]
MDCKLHFVRNAQALYEVVLYHELLDPALTSFVEDQFQSLSMNTLPQDQITHLVALLSYRCIQTAT